MSHFKLSLLDQTVLVREDAAAAVAIREHPSATRSLEDTDSTSVVLLTT